MKKKILITGGCGFIGSNLATNLAKKNFIIHIIDKKIKDKIKNKNIIYIKGNIKNYKTFKKLKDKYEAVYHLAAQASARLCEENFKEAIESNYLGTVNLCEWAKIYKPKKIIFSSSMAVYKTSNVALKENSKLIPQSIYGKTKVESEKILKKLQAFKIKIIITRLFNVYGPGQNYKNLKQGMVSIYSYYAVFNKKIKVTGSIKRFRDLIHINDVTDTLTNLLKVNKSLIINVGSGKKTFVSDLLSLICNLTNRKFKKYVKVMPSYAEDLFGTFANINRMKKIHKPKITLKKGLYSIINDIKKYKKKLD